MKDAEFYITTEEIEEKEEIPYPPPITLDGVEIRDTGWRISMVEQNDSTVKVKIYCRSNNMEWYSLTVKIPKNKLKHIGG